MRLLIVEDDYMTLEGIIKIIPWQQIGISQIEKADDGINALRLAKDFNPQIVLSDIRMPRMDGIEFASRLREILPECKIIFMSAYTDREYYKSAIKLKAINYVEKPIDIEELKNALENAAALCREDSEKLDRSIEVDRMLQSSLPFIQSELVMQLINKDFDFLKTGQIIKQLSLDLSKDSFFISIIIKIVNIKNADGSRDMQNDINGLMEALFSQARLNGISAFKDMNHFVTIVYSKPDGKPLQLPDSIEEFCDSIYEALKNSYNVSIAAGKAVHGMANIYESYNTAVLTLQKVFFCTSRPVMYYSFDSSIPYPFDNKLIEYFSDCIIKKDKYNLVLMVKQLSSKLKCHPNTLVKSVKDYYFKMLLQLIKSAESEGIPVIETEKSEEFLWDIVSKFNYLTECEDYVISKVETFFKLLEGKNRFSHTVSSILNYIHCHYHEQSLSTCAISEAIGLSSAYICVLFKEETDETIIRYITRYRMEKAKELLKDKSLKVADIANKVGYQEGDYFAKLFRKIEGLPPSEYRERYCS